MAAEKTFRIALVQLRFQEEAASRRRFSAVQRELKQVRAMISGIDQAITKCTQAAEAALREGKEHIGRGNRREVQGLTLLRAQHVGQLAGIKARLAHSRHRWIEAMQRRKALGEVEASANLGSAPSVQTTPCKKANQIYAFERVYVQEANAS